MPTPVDAENPPAASREGLEIRISSVGRQLADSLGAVVTAVHGDLNRPQELANELGIDKILSSRILKAIRNNHPMAVAHQIPGPESLRRLLRATARRDVDAELIREAEDAVSDFEQLIRVEIGDRGALDAILSGLLPEARRKLELNAKQAVFKGASRLRGAAADLDIFSAFLHPCRHGDRLDLAWVHGQLGLRRLRPGQTVKYGMRRLPPLTKKRAPEDPDPPRTLDGEPSDQLEGLMLKQFCSTPPPQLECRRVGDVNHYLLRGPAIGPSSRADVILGEMERCAMMRYQDPEAPQRAKLWGGIGIPTKAMIFDVMLHEDVYPGSDPELVIYDTGFSGPADVNDPIRDIDRMDLLETIEPLGRGLARFHAREIPRYAEMLHLLCDKMDWNVEQFRGYRCRIQFPFYGSQVNMVFDPPFRQ